MNDDCPRCAGVGFKHAQCPSCKVGPWEVSGITRQLIERDQHGRQKYGVTLDRTDLSHADWLQHMAEELMDGAGYALAAKREYERMQQGPVVPRDVLLAWRAEWMQNNPSEGDDCDRVTPFDAYLYSDPSVPPMSPAGYRVQGVGVNHTTGGFAWIHIDGVSFDAQLVARRMMQTTDLDALAAYSANTGGVQQGAVYQWRENNHWNDMTAEQYRQVHMSPGNFVQGETVIHPQMTRALYTHHRPAGGGLSELLGL